MEALVDIVTEKQVTIAAIEGSHQQCVRLREIGFLPGSGVSIIAKMPFKGPIACLIRGTKVALRYDDAACVQVVPAS